MAKIYFLAGIVQKKNKNSFTKSFRCDTTFNFTDSLYDTKVEKITLGKRKT
jgi:hypothetical protein